MTTTVMHSVTVHLYTGVNKNINDVDFNVTVVRKTAKSNQKSKIDKNKKVFGTFEKNVQTELF